jgi:hypothetical protein
MELRKRKLDVEGDRARLMEMEEETDGKGCVERKKSEVPVSRTIYDGWWSNNVVVGISFVFAFGCFVYSIVMVF